MSSIKITETERNGLLKYLPKGYGEIIAQELGVTKNTVYNTKVGKHFNPEVTTALREIALKTREEMRQEYKRIRKTIRQLSKEAA
jgi:hypothetical protein